MHETSEADKSIQGETKRVLNLGVYMKRTTELGAFRLKDRYKIAGISRATQHRWINGAAIRDMERADRVAARLKVTLDELFAEVAA